MKTSVILGLLVLTVSFNTLASEQGLAKSSLKATEVVWENGMNIDTLWLSYAQSKGGLTWGKSTSYPEYSKVKEGDTILIQVNQGPCLMEFFHSRWRRANDVKRWDDSINEYGGCAYVFN